MEKAATTNRIGKYRLIGELGEGGMAKVFLALVTGLANFNKLVVIKQIRPHLAEDPDFVTMFLDEARLAARLNHPNVVQTNEVGSEDGVYYLAMEYLEGQTFRRILGRLGPALTLPMKLRVMIEVLAGLEHAHELSDFDGTPLEVVHRDVSPHNVFISYNGQVKVVDFGIAKAIDSSAETRTGMLKGKIGYMAPEQARGDKVDPRADIFAVGVMLWELVTGQRLFKGDSEMTILHKLITHQIPRPSEVNPKTDPDLEAIILRALAAEPADRHGSARELSEALEAWLRAAGDHTHLRELGRLLAEHFAEERASIRSLVEAQIREAEERSGEVTALVRLEQSMTSSESLVAPGDDPPTRTMGTAATVVLAKKRPEPAKRPPFLWLAIAAVVVGAIAAILVLPAREGAAPPEAAPAAHVLRIESRPPGAKVQCEGRIVGVTPLEIDVPSGARSCAYVIVMNGYEPLRLESAAIHRDTALTAQLVEEPSPLGTSTAPEAAPPEKTVAAETTARVEKPAPAPGSPRPQPVAAPAPEPPPDIRLER